MVCLLEFFQLCLYSFRKRICACNKHSLETILITLFDGVVTQEPQPVDSRPIVSGLPALLVAPLMKPTKRKQILLLFVLQEEDSNDETKLKEHVDDHDLYKRCHDESQEDCEFSDHEKELRRRRRRRVHTNAEWTFVVA